MKNPRKEKEKENDENRPVKKQKKQKTPTIVANRFLREGCDDHRIRCQEYHPASHWFWHFCQHLTTNIPNSPESIFKTATLKTNGIDDDSDKDDTEYDDSLLSTNNRNLIEMNDEPHFWMPIETLNHSFISERLYFKIVDKLLNETVPIILRSEMYEKPDIASGSTPLFYDKEQLNYMVNYFKEQLKVFAEILSREGTTSRSLMVELPHDGDLPFLEHHRRLWRSLTRMFWYAHLQRGPEFGEENKAVEVKTDFPYCDILNTFAEGKHYGRLERGYKRYSDEVINIPVIQVGGDITNGVYKEINHNNYPFFKSMITRELATESLKERVCNSCKGTPLPLTFANLGNFRTTGVNFGLKIPNFNQNSVFWNRSNGTSELNLVYQCQSVYHLSVSNHSGEENGFLVNMSVDHSCMRCKIHSYEDDAPNDDRKIFDQTNDKTDHFTLSRELTGTLCSGCYERYQNRWISAHHEKIKAKGKNIFELLTTRGVRKEIFDLAKLDYLNYPALKPFSLFFKGELESLQLVHFYVATQAFHWECAQYNYARRRNWWEICKEILVFRKGVHSKLPNGLLKSDDLYKLLHEVVSHDLKGKDFANTHDVEYTNLVDNKIRVFDH